MRDAVSTSADVQPDEQLLELLEPVLRDFVRLIGWQATMEIVRMHGGTLLYVPRNAEANAALVALIGAQHAATLGAHYGTERPYIPFAMEAMRELRNRAIRARYPTTSIKRLAQEYGLSIRSVFYIVRGGCEEPDPTRPLF